jgi:hypothetical protein
MTVDLENQISNLFEGIQVSQAPLTMDEVVEHRFSTGPVQPVGAPDSFVGLRERRPWLVMGLAAVSVLVVLGGASLLLRATEPGATTDSVVMTTPTEPSVVALSPLGWSRVSIDESVIGAGTMLNGVVAGGPGLVAVGSDALGGTVWTSTDGSAGSRVPDDAGIFGAAELNSVVAGGPGFVAVGSDRSGDDPDAAVWTSPDGVTWSRVPHDEEIFGGIYSQMMTSVTVAGPGLVAVGFDGSHDHIDGGGLEDMNAAVWTSVDGVTWSRIPANDAVFGGGGHQVMRSVIAGGPGLVAVGFDGPDGGEVGYGDTYPAVWTSLDGIAWSRVAHDELVFGGGHSAMSSVADGDAGLVAVGYDESHLPIWTSMDGITWSRVADNESIVNPADLGYGLGTVIFTGSSFVAVGETERDQYERDAVVWLSHGGLIWSNGIANDESIQGDEVGMRSVTVGGPGLVAVGDDGAVWVTQLEDK